MSTWVCVHVHQHAHAHTHVFISLICKVRNTICQERCKSELQFHHFSSWMTLDKLPNFIGLSLIFSKMGNSTNLRGVLQRENNDCFQIKNKVFSHSFYQYKSLFLRKKVIFKSSSILNLLIFICSPLSTRDRWERWIYTCI